MKLLIASSLLCAMVALTTAADEGSSDEAEGLITPEEHHVEKRATSCPLGWARYSNRCYRYYSHPLAWAQAQRNCQSVKANLASIHSLGEYNFIRRVIFHATYNNGETWIAGSDAQKEGYWFWIDGTRFTYTNWCHGQPDNFQGSQHCMVMNWIGRNCWDDQHCSALHPSVCVKKI